MEGITLTVRPLNDLYNLTVIALCSGAVILTLKLFHSSGEARRRRMMRSAHWVGSGALFERGIAGLVVDGVADLVWWPTSLVGGIRFGAVAGLTRRAVPDSGGP